MSEIATSGRPHADTWQRIAVEPSKRRRRLTVVRLGLMEQFGEFRPRFVLKYLLGYPNVKNYDGSWTEGGNLVGAPVER